MQSPKSNQRNNQKVDERHIRERLDRAQESFTTSKQGAAKAAAYLWLVLDETRSDMGQQWLQSEIDAEAKRRKSANEDLDELKRRVAKHAKGSLKEDDYRGDEDKADLQSLVSRTKEEWAALRKLPVNPRAGASPYTALARYGLRIEIQADAPLASRYALVVQWAEEQDKHFEDVDEIVAAIGAAGGFEAVVEAQRKKNAGAPVSGDDDSEDRKITATALAQDAVAAVAAATPIATFEFRTDKARQGLTRFVARYTEGRAEIIGEAPLGEDEAGRAAIQVAQLQTNPGAEFVQRVLALEELVVEGKETGQTVDGTQTGERLKEERTYCLLPEDPSSVQTKQGEASANSCRILISAARADAGLVVIASPADGLDFGSPNTAMVMPRKAMQQLSAALDQPAAPHLVNVLADHTDGLAWALENRALIQAKRPNGRRLYVWQPLTAEHPKPLEVRAFEPQFTTAVAMEQVRHLYEHRLAAWGEKGGTRSQKLATLAFRHDQITFEVRAAENLSIRCEEIVEPVSLLFRARDLYLVVRALIDQPTDSIELSGDDAGLLEIKWKDVVGEYAVYQPTASTDGRLQGRCLAPMRLGKAASRQREPAPA